MKLITQHTTDVIRRVVIHIVPLLFIVLVICAFQLNLFPDAPKFYLIYSSSVAFLALKS